MRILGVTLAYNEEDCIGNTIAILKRCCDGIMVFDHGSTDNTLSIAQEADVNTFSFDRSKFPPKDRSGRQTSEVWQLVARWILCQNNYFEWVVWLDADEILRTPQGKLPTKTDIEHAATIEGVNVIRPLIREFCMTKVDSEGNDYLHRLRYYRKNELGHAPRAWSICLTPENVPPGRHIQDPSTGKKVHPFYLFWPEGTKVSNNKWLLDHYPFRSREQAKRKVLHDRNWITPLGKRKYFNYIRNGSVDVTVSRNKLTLQASELETP